MAPPSVCLVTAAVLILLGVGCTAAAQNPCPEGTDPFTELNVYFGQEKGSGGTVTEEEWRAFLAETVTPRFPDGLTVLDARGQWFDTSEGRLYVESTKLLNVLVPADSTDAGMESVRQISDTYKQRFDQQAVFITNLPACATVF